MSTPTQRPRNATPLLPTTELVCEVLDPSTGNVWQSLEPITRDEYRDLSLEAGWVRVGVGRAAMNEHWFTRSPGREEDGPMELLEVGGRQFGLCARPADMLSPPPGSEGLRKLLVDKHHVVRFGAGREVPVLIDTSGERFVHVIQGGQGSEPLALPHGWKLEHVELAEDWVVALPNPTTVFFFASGDSFQGPLALPSPSGRTREVATGSMGRS